MTSKDHSSLAVPTGPWLPWALWPCWKAALLTQSLNASSELHRVYTRQTSRPSLGRSSSKASKPGDFDTSPARLAKRFSNSSIRSAGTVMALIRTTLKGNLPYLGSAS
jgi:hypothetical protein